MTAIEQSHLGEQRISVGTMANRIQRRLQQEEEFLLSPTYFAQYLPVIRRLAEWIFWLSGASVTMKCYVIVMRSSYINEIKMQRHVTINS
ncbi:hypothetical protein XBKB1_4160004 [Xenorhabdus bovienii str. kraussei Becker Underwood]|uniref:Uncharacterized protein n=1 Tax=Xenorhabdus bovienii str. kraussei Becker Underwood TaxID=1398204 RepID=A0A077PX12_XENBV|nr:hypothetical protein XBKB1_4160004 [Xenorhabdus bovienii str. kraussei Becker Underwood]